MLGALDSKRKNGEVGGHREESMKPSGLGIDAGREYLGVEELRCESWKEEGSLTGGSPAESKGVAEGNR